MSGASSLQKGVLNLATMRSHDLQLFVDILRSARSANGQIDLVFDPSLSGPLGLVLEMPALIEQGTAKIYYLGMPIPNPHPALLWVLRPDTKLTHTLVSCISKCPPGIKHVCETLLSLFFSLTCLLLLLLHICVGCTPLPNADGVLCSKEVAAVRPDSERRQCGADGGGADHGVPAVPDPV